MKTLIFDVRGPDTGAGVRTAADILKRGGLAAFPTETVYGLGADALNPAAVAKIFQAKGRPADNPLIAHIADAGDLDKYCAHVPEAAYELARKFWPGPLTMVLRRSALVPDIMTAGLDTVAVRIPDCDIALALIRAAGSALAAPSANLSGRPSPTEAGHVLADLDGVIDAVLDGGPCKIGIESTVLDLTSQPAGILRPGGVGIEELKTVLGDVGYDFHLSSGGGTPPSPGMKYRHYSPSVKVCAVRGDSAAASETIWRMAENYVCPAVICFRDEAGLYGGMTAYPMGTESDPSEMAANMYAAFRAAENEGRDVIFMRCPRGGGIAPALEDRIRRAASEYYVIAEKLRFFREKNKESPPAE